MSTPSSERPDRPARAPVGRLQAWRSLRATQQRTAVAAIVLLVTIGLPWYTTEVVFRAPAGQRPPITHGTMSGFGAFSFVEAAVLLVTAAVLALVWGRATRRRFTLPFDDGTMVVAAAGWIGLLIVYRLFDKPDNSQGANSTTLIGLSWGIFASLVAVGLLGATGLDQRRRAQAATAAAPGPVDGPVLDPRTVVAPPLAARPVRAADDRPREARREPGADRGPRRRPAPEHDDTRWLSREEAAAELRQAGVVQRAPGGSEVADATRVTGRRDEDATQVAARPDEDATQVVPRSDADATRVVRGPDADATQVVPRPDADATQVVPGDGADPTRVAPPAPGEDAPKHRRGRRR